MAVAMKIFIGVCPMAVDILSDPQHDGYSSIPTSGKVYVNLSTCQHAV